MPRDGILSFDEILRILRIGAGMGIRKVRITGGEPLTRRNVLSLVRGVAMVPGVEDIGVSTNGTLLADVPAEESDGSVSMARRLVEAGVRTVNISLDTLNKSAYASITNRDYHARAIAGIQAACMAGFDRVKLNCVLMKGRTEHEVSDLVDFSHHYGCLLRFIELMPVSTTEVLTADNFLSCGAIQQILTARYGPLVPCPEIRTNGPASYWRIPDRNQLVGFIGAMTNLHFCESCNKLRLTADGKLRPCLGSHMETDLITPMRAGASDHEIIRLIADTVDRKPKEHDFRTTYLPGRRMIAIGG